MDTSAGCVLVDRSGDAPRALLIRVRAHGFELPKGHIELDETPEQAALRELLEETGLRSAVDIGEMVGAIEYSFPSGGRWIQKRVEFYIASANGVPEFDELPAGTREMRWVTLEELEAIQLVSENLRAIVKRALKFAHCPENTEVPEA